MAARPTFYRESAEMELLLRYHALTVGGKSPCQNKDRDQCWVCWWRERVNMYIRSQHPMLAYNCLACWALFTHLTELPIMRKYLTEICCLTERARQGPVRGGILYMVNGILVASSPP